LNGLAGRRRVPMGTAALILIPRVSVKVSATGRICLVPEARFDDAARQ